MNEMEPALVFPLELEGPALSESGQAIDGSQVANPEYADPSGFSRTLVSSEYRRALDRPQSSLSAQF